MCIKKRKTNVPKKVFLATNISELLSGSIPVKCNDPRCPIITWTIGQTEISRALLDLGASINLLPLSVYQQLGLRELLSTRLTIQFADRSVKVSKGEITNVHIRVRNFINPVDFFCAWNLTRVKPWGSYSCHLRITVLGHCLWNNQLQDCIYKIDIWRHDKGGQYFQLRKTT